MKPIAENRIEITRQLFDEGMRAVENKEYKKLALKVALAVLLITAAAAAYLLHTGGSLILLAGEGIFFAAMLVWVAFVLPKNKRKSSYQAMCRKSNGTLSRTIRFYSDHMSILSGEEMMITIPYQDVLEWRETKHLWVLTCREKTGVLIKKDGFVTGNADMVKAAMNHS